jgi:hypothetical protein
MFSRRPTFLLRLAVCFFALLQGVAVSWHVCELGGNVSAAPCHTTASSNQQCHAEADPTRAWRMTLDGATKAQTALHCLAALLATTPAQTAQTFELSAVFARRTVSPQFSPRFVSHASPRGIEARGPPSASSRLA